VHAESAQRPAECSLADHGPTSRAAFEASLAALPVLVSLPAASEAALRASVPGEDTRAALEAARHTLDGTAGDRLTLRLRMESVEIAASQLLAVPGAEVHEPMEVRRLLHERAAELAALNRPRTADGTHGRTADEGFDDS